MTCPSCGHVEPAVVVDQAAEVDGQLALADAIEATAEIHETAETERTEVEAQARVEIATVEAEAAVEIATAQAEAAVEIAEAQAEAVVEIAEAQVDEAAELADAAEALAEVDEHQAVEPADEPDSDGVTAVDVPPQPAAEQPGQRSTRNAGRRIGPMRRRRR